MSKRISFASVLQQRSSVSPNSASSLAELMEAFYDSPHVQYTLRFKEGNNVQGSSLKKLKYSKEQKEYNFDEWIEAQASQNKQNIKDCQPRKSVPIDVIKCTDINKLKINKHQKNQQIQQQNINLKQLSKLFNNNLIDQNKTTLKYSNKMNQNQKQQKKMLNNIKNIGFKNQKIYKTQQKQLINPIKKQKIYQLNNNNILGSHDKQKIYPSKLNIKQNLTNKIQSMTQNIINLKNNYQQQDQQQLLIDDHNLKYPEQNLQEQLKNQIHQYLKYKIPNKNNQKILKNNNNLQYSGKIGSIGYSFSSNLQKQSIKSKSSIEQSLDYFNQISQDDDTQKKFKKYLDISNSKIPKTQSIQFQRLSSSSKQSMQDIWKQDFKAKQSIKPIIEQQQQQIDNYLQTSTYKQQQLNQYPEQQLKYSSQNLSKQNSKKITDSISNYEISQVKLQSQSNVNQQSDHKVNQLISQVGKSYRQLQLSKILSNDYDTVIQEHQENVKQNNQNNDISEERQIKYSIKLDLLKKFSEKQFPFNTQEKQYKQKYQPLIQSNQIQQTQQQIKPQSIYSNKIQEIKQQRINQIKQYKEQLTIKQQTIKSQLTCEPQINKQVIQQYQSNILPEPIKQNHNIIHSTFQEESILSNQIQIDNSNQKQNIKTKQIETSNSIYQSIGNKNKKIIQQIQNIITKPLLKHKEFNQQKSLQIQKNIKQISYQNQQKNIAKKYHQQIQQTLFNGQSQKKLQQKRQVYQEMVVLKKESQKQIKLFQQIKRQSIQQQNITLDHKQKQKEYQNNQIGESKKEVKIDLVNEIYEQKNQINTETINEIKKDLQYSINYQIKQQKLYQSNQLQFPIRQQQKIQITSQKNEYNQKSIKKQIIQQKEEINELKKQILSNSFSDKYRLEQPLKQNQLTLINQQIHIEQKTIPDNDLEKSEAQLDIQFQFDLDLNLDL